jgi:hypothetical protein
MNFCKEQGIKDLIRTYTLKKNKVDEKKNRTIVEMTRNIFKAKKLLNEYWGEVVVTTVYLIN